MTFCRVKNSCVPFLSATNGQRPSNYFSSCSCFTSSSCSPFGSIPHLNKLKKIWLAWDSNVLPPDDESDALSTELLQKMFYITHFKRKIKPKLITNLAADLGPVLVVLLVNFQNRCILSDLEICSLKILLENNFSRLVLKPSLKIPASTFLLLAF